MKTNRFTLAVAVLCLSAPVYAHKQIIQSEETVARICRTTTPINYRKYPYWIEMMKDSNVNYFEAVKAFETFWKGKEKPLEEDELIGQKKTKAANTEKESRHEIRERAWKKKRYRRYALDCKKFEYWKLQARPYVQENGHILTSYERLKLWQERQKH